MRLVVLGSGSGGNAVVVESAGRRLLIDAGFSCRELARRYALKGGKLDDLDAVLLTHEHGDHVRGVRVLRQRHRLAVYATAGTLSEMALERTPSAQVNVIRSGEPFEVAGFHVEAFGLPHDAREPVGFVVEDGAGRRLGLVADLGTRTQLAWTRLRNLDALILETNHDLDMLRTGPYPWSLKQRVAGRHGHLSNHEAAEGLPELLSERLGTLVLYHLSQTNNLPALAIEAISEKLDREDSGARLVVAEQDEPTPWLEIGA